MATRRASPARHREQRPPRVRVVPRPAFALPWVLAGIVVLALAAAHIAHLRFVCDDAFISFRYARNLAEGQGLVFNPGERVEGYTNFLWVLVSAGLIRAGIGPETGTTWVSGAFALATIALGMLFLARRSPVGALVFGALLAASGGFAAWATGGLETALFTSLLFAAFLGLVASLETERAESAARLRIASAACLVLAMLTRPAGLMFAGLSAAFLAVHAWNGRVSWRAYALWLGAWVVPLGAYLAWRVDYYGHLLPNTFRVRAEAGALLPTGLAYLEQVAVRQHLWLWALPVVVLLAVRRPPGLRPGIWGLGIVWAVPFLAYVAFMGGDFMDMGRMVVPVLPVLALLSSGAWAALTGRLGERLPRALAAAPLVLGLVAHTVLCLGTTQDSLREWHRGVDSIGLLRRYAGDWRQVSRLVAQISHPTDTIAVSAAGIIPYYTGLYTVDQLGLVAPDLSGYRSRRDMKLPGHGLIASTDLLLRLRPHLLLGHPVLTETQTQNPPSLILEPNSGPRIHPLYRMAAAQAALDPPRYFTLAVRRDILGRRGQIAER